MIDDASLLDVTGGLLGGAVNVTEDAGAPILGGSAMFGPGPKPACEVCGGLSSILSAEPPVKTGRGRLSKFWLGGAVPASDKNSCSVVGVGPRWLNRSGSSRVGPWPYDCGWGG